jgi:hypothetical protein
MYTRLSLLNSSSIGLFLISGGNVVRYEGAEGSAGPDTVLGIEVGLVLAIGGRKSSAKSAVKVQVFVHEERGQKEKFGRLERAALT